MTTPNDLTSLAARMQEAQADEQETLLIQAWAVIGTSMGEPYNRFCWMIEAGAYESAALMLVPKGWRVANLCQQDNEKWWAELRRGHLTSYDKTSIGSQLDPAAPALAIASAALLAHVENQSHD